MSTLSFRNRTRPWPAVVALLVLALAVITGCAAGPTNPVAPAAPTTNAGTNAATAYPLTLTSPFGSTVLAAKPVRIATVSHVDTDIALALGIVPVISPRYGQQALDPWTVAAARALGKEKLDGYDSTDGTNAEAIAAAAPDVILATSGWTLDTDYANLSKIAPVVTYEGKDGLASMTWRERTEVAAAALGESEAGRTVIADVERAFAAAKQANPDFVGTSYTYAVLHPEQISYVSYRGGDNDFFLDLGFTLPTAAADFDENNQAVSPEQIDRLDADVLMVGYPFADEGLMRQEVFEANTLFKRLSAVRDGHYLVIDDQAASPLAYPTPLSQPWVLDYLLPKLQQAVAG